MKAIVWNNLKVGIVAACCVVVGAVCMFVFDHRSGPPAPPPDLAMPASVTTDVGKPVMIEATTSGKVVKFHAWDRVGLVTAGDKKTWAHSDKAGTYKVYGYTSVGCLPTDMVFTTVTVGSVPPGPNPPGPDPVPPGPTPPGPTPSPAPIPLAGLRVLIVYDAKTVDKLPKAQQDILYSQEIRTLFNAKCIVGADGKTKDYWIVKTDDSFSAMPKYWQDAWARPRTSIPWLLISNGTSGFEGPLPADVAAMTTLLAKY